MAAQHGLQPVSPCLQHPSTFITPIVSAHTPLPFPPSPHTQEDLAGVRRGLAEAQVALAGAVLENSELRREAAAGWMAAEPAVVQVRGAEGADGGR
jgi:hypothetical protein